MTCCSTESSFLERRCSAITLGLSSLSRASSRRASRDVWDHHQQHFPGIHIIEATPKSSPCPSERQSHLINNSSGSNSNKDHIKVLGRFKRRRHEDNSIDSISEYPDEVIEKTITTAATANSNYNEMSINVNNNSNNNQQNHQQKINSKMLVSNNNNNHNSSKIDDDTSHNNNGSSCVKAADNGERRAPLASLSSFKMSSAECADSMEDANGSVFEASCADTDDDLEQFSTDSDEISLQSPPSTDQHVPSGGNSGSTVVKCDNSVILRDSPAATPVAVAVVEDIERQQRSNDKLSTIRPVNYLITSDKAIKSNSSECFASVDYNNEKRSSLKPSTLTPTSSAVILEMPVLVKHEQPSPSHHHDSDTHRLLDPAIDPTDDDDENNAAAGKSSSNRKWSKETLF